MGFQGGGPGAGRGPAGAQRKPSLLQAFESLKYSEYRILWISQLFSFMGMQMQMVARGLLAFELAGNNTAVGITMVAWGLPQLAFSLVGGAVADRVDKRNIILISQLGTGLLSLFNAILITTDQISILWLFILGLAQGTLFAFNMPARQAFVAELVPQPSLMNAIALNNVGMNATRVVAPAAAGIMIGVWGIESAYYTQSIMLLVVVGLTLLLPKSRAHLQGAAARKGIFQEIGIGLRYIASSRTMMLLMLMAFIPTLLGMPYMTLLPGFRDELGLGSREYGFMFTITGIGAVVGSVAVASLTSFSRKPLLQAVMGLGYGLSLAALGLGAMFAGFPGSLVALLLLGLFSTTYQTLNNTMVMAETRPEFYGRVMSVYMLTFSLFPLMSAPMGIVADQISATTTFIVLGAVITAFIALTIVLAPRYTFRRTNPSDAGGHPGFRGGAGAAAAPPAPTAPTAPAPVEAPGAGSSPAPGVPALSGLPVMPRTATAALRAGDSGQVAGVPAARRRMPRRDYLGSPASAAASPPDYMRGRNEAHTPSMPSAASRDTSPATDAEAMPGAGGAIGAGEPIAFPGAGAYGLVSRRGASVTPPGARRTYGLDTPATLRAISGRGPVEAGDGGWLGAFAGGTSSAGGAVGSFRPAPIERVVVPSTRRTPDETSRPMLIAALTAGLGSSLLSLLSLLLRRGGRSGR